MLGAGRGQRERSWVGNCSSPSCIVTSLGIGLSWASAVRSPFKGRFSSRLVNYAGPASGRPAVTVNASGKRESAGRCCSCRKHSLPINAALLNPFHHLFGLPGGPGGGLWGWLQNPPPCEFGSQFPLCRFQSARSRSRSRISEGKSG